MSHQLDRLELEVRTADEALARQLLDRLGRLHRQALEEVLARVLDQLSPRGTRQRLERLELDLGEIPLDQLERQLPERLEQALRQALPPRLRTVRSKPTIPRPHPSDDPPQMPSPPATLPRPLELLDCFATTGTLPWWAPRDDARLIPATCAAALRLPPAILSPFLRQLANTPTARGRLLAAVPPAQRRLLQEALGKATSSHEQPPADAPTSSEAIQSAWPTPTRPPSSNNPDNPISSDSSDQHSHVPSPASSVDSLRPVSSVSSSPSPSPTVDTPRPAGKAPRSLSDATSLSSSRVTPSQPDSTPTTQQPGPNLTRQPSSNVTDRSETSDSADRSDRSNRSDRSDRSNQLSQAPSTSSPIGSRSPVGFVNPVNSAPRPGPNDDTPRPAGEATRSLSDATSLSSSRVTPSQPDSTPPTQQLGPNLSSDPSSISSSSTAQPTTPVHAAPSPTVGDTPARGESSRLLSHATSLSSSRVTPSQPDSTPPTQQPGPTLTRQPSSNVPDRSEASDSSNRSDRSDRSNRSDKSDRSNQQSQAPSKSSPIGSLSPVGFVNPVSSSPSPSPTVDTPRPAGKATRSLPDAASLPGSRVTPSQPDSTPPTQQLGPNLTRQPSSNVPDRSENSDSADRSDRSNRSDKSDRSNQLSQAPSTSSPIGSLSPVSFVNSVSSAPRPGPNDDTPRPAGEATRSLADAASLSSSRVTPSQSDSTPPTQQLGPNHSSDPSSNVPDRSEASDSSNRSDRSNRSDKSDKSNQQSQALSKSSPIGSLSPIGFVNPVNSAPRPGPTGDITPPSAEPLLPFRPRLGESLTVDGAGLALLWPFLDTLFARLGWLTPEQLFVGAAEQQRAMALLGYLADGDPGPPEWRLTLAKLLCGLSLDAVYLLEEDLSEVERAEADKLLQAVLAHGDGLLGDEVDTLRATWLRRPGLLTWRPQAWLLVVERRSPLDGALDRLPWSASWLRLPWMAESVQVAW